MTGGRGLLVAVEGIDGAGKSTQVAALVEALATAGHEVVVAPPHGTGAGRQLIAALLGHDHAIEPWTEALVFTAARAQLVREVIAPALARGVIVVADRFVDSTLAYQGAGRGLDEGLLRQLHREACGDLWPHLTVLLELTPSLAAARLLDGPGPDRIEKAPFDFHQRVAAGFAALAGREPSRFLRLDAAQPRERLAEAIEQAVRSRAVVV